ncbi:MAG: hypothetical protein SOY04_02600 [Clostridium celatum]|nr:hypothetical protein [Clostridium celatum]
MSKYIKHKKFIPINFIESKSMTIEKNNGKAIFLLLLINIFIFPQNIKGIFLKEEKYEFVEVKANDYIDINEIEKWIALDNEHILRFTVRDNTGKVVLKSDEALNYIEQLGVTIKKYNIEDDEILVEVDYD